MQPTELRRARTPGSRIRGFSLLAAGSGHRALRIGAAVLLLGFAPGCAGWFSKPPEPVQFAIPDKPKAIRAAIAAERQRLLDLMNAPLPDAASEQTHRAVVVAIARRLGRLEKALAEHDTSKRKADPAASTSPTAPPAPPSP